MRNLKKVLSLSLALVMLLGMMVMGAGAATYDDVAADASKAEAIQVMSALEILKGDGTGKFNPTQTLTRAEAAVIISKVLLTPAVVEKLGAMSTNFTDLAGEYEWAIPYVEACATSEIIVGNGDGTYGPGDKLTGEAFAKMLLVTIGFDASSYNGNANWAMLVRQDAIKANLGANGVLVSNTELSRQDAAQMAFNALKYSPSGTTWEVKGVKFDNANDAAMYAALVNMGRQADEEAVTPTVVPSSDSLAVSRFKLTPDTKDDGQGRVIKTWKVDGKEVYASAPEAASLTYTGEEFNWADMEKDGYTKAESIAVYYNGTKINSDAAAEYFTNLNGGYGATIELYCTNKTVNKAIVTESYFTIVKTAAEKEGAEVVLTVLEAGYNRTAGNANGKDITITKDSKAEYALVKDLAKGDVFMGVFQSDWDKDTGRGQLKAIAGEPEVIEGKVTARKMKPEVDSKAVYTGSTITIDGATYKFASEYTRVNVTVGKEGRFYLFNDYVYHYAVIGEEHVASKDYALIIKAGITVQQGTSWQTAANASKKVEAVVVLSDGSVGTYELAVNNEGKVVGATNVDIPTTTGDISGLKGKVFGYTEKDGKLTLEALATTLAENAVVSGDAASYASSGVGATSAAIDSKTALFNSKTVFVTYTVQNNELKVGGVYTGPAALGQVAYATADSNGNNGKSVAVMTGVDSSTATVNVVFVNGTRSDVETEMNYVYVIKGFEEVLGADGKTVVRQYEAYNLDGEKVAVYQNTTAGGSAVDALTANGLYTINGDGFISSSTVENTSVVSEAEVTVIGDQLKSGSKWYNMTGDTVTVEVAGKLETGCKAVLVLTKAGADDVATIFVTEKKSS